MSEPVNNPKTKAEAAIDEKIEAGADAAKGAVVKVAEEVVHAAVALVKMVHPDPAPGAPAEAEVHPDEVGNMQAGGWKQAE